MILYSSIPRLNADDNYYHTYAKIDGSNLRFEYKKGKGFYKFGSRTQLIDLSSPLGKVGIPKFRDCIEPYFLEHIAENKIEGLTVFCELAGPNSFAGQHEDELLIPYVIDVHVSRKGMLPPEQYNDMMSHMEVPMANYLGYLKWDNDFVTQVKEGSFPGQSFEGVVGKRVERNFIKTNKAKSNAWIKAVEDKYKEKAYLVI